MAEPYSGRAWIELDMAALRHNVRSLSALLPPRCRLMPAVKANAYGHGAVPVARELNALGINDFCVASAEEGAELRRHGISGNILVLGCTPPAQFALLERWALQQTIVDFEYSKLLRGLNVRSHLAVDTGMHRIGEPCENYERILELFRTDGLNITGIYTHLCAADGGSAEDRAFTLRQASSFWSLVGRLNAEGIRPSAHILSSYGLLNYPELGGDFARAGVALYGLLSTKEDTQHCRADLRPVLSLKARVTSVRSLRKGESLGYGLAYTAEHDTTVAALSIGYADGLPRALSCGAGSVLLGGRRVPIIGRICMDQTLVDVGGAGEVRSGDSAVLIGSDVGQTIGACDVAAAAGTISNELLSRLGSRLERAVKNASAQPR